MLNALLLVLASQVPVDASEGSERGLEEILHNLPDEQRNIFVGRYGAQNWSNEAFV